MYRMASLESRGVALGYTVVDGLNDPITIPDGAVEGLVLKLAIRLAPQFDAAVTQELRINAREAESAMFMLGVKTQPAKFPGTVPIGSGNEDDFHNSSHFYEEGGTQILNEADNAILTESETT